MNRLIVVDDDASVREALVSYLGARGFVVQAVGEAVEVEQCQLGDRRRQSCADAGHEPERGNQDRQAAGDRLPAQSPEAAWQ